MVRQDTPLIRSTRALPASISTGILVTESFAVVVFAMGVSAGFGCGSEGGYSSGNHQPVHPARDNFALLPRGLHSFTMRLFIGPGERFDQAYWRSFGFALVLLGATGAAWAEVIRICTRQRCR